MSKIVLNDVTNLNALSVINDNFDKLEQELQTKVLYRDNPEGEPNTLENDVDANGNSLYNIQDLTITGSFTVNGLDIEEVITEATQGIEDNAIAAQNAATAAAISAAAANASAAAAASSEANAADSETAAAASESNAASSATAAASSASTATTQAGIATTKASEASASASAAATSASSASTSASTATTQAGIATTQATNAASSASSASTSATSAANSAAAAATALDSFDDRYLGTKSSDPTLDNDGNALLTGALYYSSTEQAMKVYDGASWILASSAGAASMNVFKFVATAGQTTFTGAASVGGTLSYTSGNIIVFMNGAALDAADYTASNGTSVVLGSAASLNDELVIVAFESFTVADTYSQTAADARFVHLTGAETVAGVKTFSSQPVFSAGIDLSSNGQVKFPASQNASSDANTLDDYEEGTWTPVVKLGATTLTSASGSCVYTKIGRVVILYAEVYNIIKAGSGDLTISGLPFACAYQYGVPGDSRWGNINTGGKLTPLLGAGSTSMAFQNYNSTSGYAGSTADANVSSTFHLYNVSLIYFTS